MDRHSTPSRKDWPTRRSADISVPRLRPGFPKHLNHGLTYPVTFYFTLVPSVIYTPVTRRTALYYIPRGGRRAEPAPWDSPVVRPFFSPWSARHRDSATRLETRTLASRQRDEAHACYSEARSSGRYTLTRRPGSHCSLDALQRDQRRQLLPDGTPCLLRPKGSVLHQVFFR